MEIFIVSGAPQTGKTSRIHFICDWLISRGYSVDPSYTFSPVSSYGYTSVIPDFTCLLYKGAKKVLLHSATDDENCINTLKTHIDTNIPDVVITSCRDYNDYPRDYFCRIFGLVNGLSISGTPSINIEEFPLARITRRGVRFSSAYDWYFTVTLNQIKNSLLLSPYNL